MDKEKMKKYALYGGAGLAVILIIVMSSRQSPESSSSGPAKSSGPVYVPVDSSSSGTNPSAVYEALGSGMEALADNQNELAKQIQEAKNSESTEIAKALQELRNLQEKTSQDVTGPTTESTADKITIYGNSIDLGLARSYLQSEGKTSNFDFVDVSGMSDSETRNLLLSDPGGYALGGADSIKGVNDYEISGTGITRIAGADRWETLDLFKRRF